jgi:CspA family cold shock protein
MEERETGMVKWFHDSEGYGTIARENGEEIFVHYRSIAGAGYRTLREGQRVEFAVIAGEKGHEAQDVILL